jgi:hypothetical protein
MMLILVTVSVGMFNAIRTASPQAFSYSQARRWHRVKQWRRFLCEGVYGSEFDSVTLNAMLKKLLQNLSGGGSLLTPLASKVVQ